MTGLEYTDELKKLQCKYACLYKTIWSQKKYMLCADESGLGIIYSGLKILNNYDTRNFDQDILQYNCMSVECITEILEHLKTKLC